MNVSIFIPRLNEAESIKELVTWIISIMKSNNYSYEVIFIDDGSTDNSWSIIEELASENPNVKGIRFMKNFGKSQALHAGFAKAQGDVIITMDADLQDSPEEIPGLYNMITSQNFDLVSGWKKKRYDSVVAKNLPSKLFNWAARKTSGVELNDFNCGLKAYKNVVIKNIEVSGEMHRYIPVLAKNAGFGKIGEKVVQHQARKYGETKFGMERFINGFMLAGYIGISKLYHMYNNMRYSLVTDNPWFFIALTTMVLGTQLFLAGFLGEIILRTKNNEERYKISSEVNL